MFCTLNTSFKPFSKRNYISSVLVFPLLFPSGYLWMPSTEAHYQLEIVHKVKNFVQGQLKNFVLFLEVHYTQFIQIRKIFVKFCFKLFSEIYPHFSTSQNFLKHICSLTLNFVSLKLFFLLLHLIHEFLFLVLALAEAREF